MESAEVIASIKSIYKRFRLPENLRMHMFRAAGVGELVYDHFTEKMDGKWDTVAALLTHDLGNIVKFNLDATHVYLIGNESRRLDYWKKVQKEVIRQYGSSNDHVVTRRMAIEAGINERVISIIDRHWQEGRSMSSHDMAMKVCMYGDCRVGPFGVVSVKERFADLIERYKGTWRVPGYHKAVGEVLRAERYILRKTDLKPEGINDKSIEPYLAKYMHGRKE